MTQQTSADLFRLLHQKLEDEAALRVKKRVAKRLALIRPKPMNGKVGKDGRAS